MRAGLSACLEAGKFRRPATQRFVMKLFENRRYPDLLSGVFGNSGFLTQMPGPGDQFAPIIFGHGPDAAYDRSLRTVRTRPGASAKDTISRLRRAKRRVALLTALADLSGAWPLETVTARLSSFARVALSTARGHCSGPA